MLDAFARPEIAVLVGILGAALLVVIARVFARRREMLVYGVGLGFTGLAYMIFGLQHGAPSDYFGREAAGAAVFLVAAVLGTRRWPALLALGWTVHAEWDLFFHYANGPAFSPAGYAFFCVGFDLLVGGYIVGRISKKPGVTRM